MHFSPSDFSIKKLVLRLPKASSTLTRTFDLQSLALGIYKSWNPPLGILIERKPSTENDSSSGHADLIVSKLVQPWVQNADHIIGRAEDWALAVYRKEHGLWSLDMELTSIRYLVSLTVTLNIAGAEAAPKINGRTLSCQIRRVRCSGSRLEYPKREQSPLQAKNDVASM